MRKRGEWEGGKSDIKREAAQGESEKQREKERKREIRVMKTLVA